MYCHICGNEDAKYYPAKHNYLCAFCANDTPNKISRATFYERYFGKDAVPESTKREFYDDYRNSSLTYSEYERATISIA